MLKIDFDKSADAVTLVFRSGKVSRDHQVAENVFAGFNKKGELIELQVLDLAESDEVWITVEAAAKILGKNERTLLRWIHSGKIQSKKIGREYRIPLDQIQEMAS